MRDNVYKKAIFTAIALAIALAAAGFLLPLCLPFLLGAGLALAAEPAVSALRRHIPKGAATAIGVSGVFVLATTVLVFLLAFLIRQVRSLSSTLPQMEEAAQQGISALQNWLLDLSGRLPGNIGAVTTEFLQTLFSDSTSLLGQAAMKLPEIATGLLAGISKGMLWIITGIISGYMISARLPDIRQWLSGRMMPDWRQRYLPALAALRKALGGWIAAELKLAGVAFILLSLGFLFLRIENSLLWAGLITMVDAFPILGVGTALVPWSIACLLQGQSARGVGLLGLYALIWLVRSVLEPKLLGKELGLDPLVTLMAIYAGFKLWGLPGMLLAPIVALAAVQLVKQLDK